MKIEVNKTRDFAEILLGYMNSEPGSERREYFQGDINALCKTFNIDEKSIMSREDAHKRIGVSNRLDAWDTILRSEYSESDFTHEQFVTIQLAMFSISWE